MTIAPLAALLGLATCGPDGQPEPPRASTVARGTILAMRPVEPEWGTGAAVLQGLARTASPPTPDKQDHGKGPPIDFVVREASGATIAVVQSNDQNLQVGDTVEIIRAGRTRLARPGV
jgi:outer membrane lipoprotein SlyB